MIYIHTEVARADHINQRSTRSCPVMSRSSNGDLICPMKTTCHPIIPLAIIAHLLPVAAGSQANERVTTLATLGCLYIFQLAQKHTAVVQERLMEEMDGDGRTPSIKFDIFEWVFQSDIAQPQDAYIYRCE